ncbi:MAG TPA: DUF2207 domain-containing protein [Candidatus Dormibacteraeota bacterium]
MRWRFGLLLPVLALALALLPAPAQAADWSVDSFDSRITIAADGSLKVVEDIEVTFSGPHHGIYRDIPVVYDHDQKNNRVLELNIDSVSGPGGYTTSRNGADEQIKIGDPHQTLTGRQSYRITYTVRGAFNGFPDHDELYWNVTGNQWGVPIGSATATVAVPSGSLQRQTCFQGPNGSTDPCSAAAGGDNVSFQATHALGPGEGLTVVVALSKGAIPNPVPILEAKPRSLPEYFELNPATLVAFWLVLAAGLGLFGWYWWLHGRDREYTTAYYTQHDANAPDELVPMFQHRPVVVEFEPPDGLRPAQLGLMLDESADTKDVTATIIDLAARGYLTITEVPGSGIFARGNYQLKKGANTDQTQLQPYERTIYYGLFKLGDDVFLSTLRGTFKSTLDDAEAQLYKDGMTRKWFTHHPAWTRTGWLFLGIGTVVAGAVLTFLLGALLGAGLIGVAIVLVGVLVIVMHGSMPQKTAAGHDVLMRTLGFRMYMTTAEKYQQKFAEREKLFTAYLPYAIVFGCVDRWVHAFRDIDVTAATGGWYVGAAGFNTLAFSNSLQSFNSTVATSIAYVPASSGSSGFSGGGGGGFGGGGGGSW